MNYFAFNQRYPDIQISSELFEVYLTDAKAETSLIQWGEMKPRVTLLLVAHYATLPKATQQEDDTNQTQTGSVKKIELRHDDGYTVEFSPENDPNGSFTVTPYGKEYLRLISLLEHAKKNNPASSTITVGNRKANFDNPFK